MLVSVTIIRYPKKYIFFALIAMAIHRLPLWMNKNIRFFKLMGSGKNGSFDINPDWQQWAILATHSYQADSLNVQEDYLVEHLYGPFITRWIRTFKCQTAVTLLDPIEGHGQWDNQKPFGELSTPSNWDGRIAVLTRATIRLSKLKAFWKNVAGSSSELEGSPGFEGSVGIGEIPFIKQATLSTWTNKQHMKDFAYRMRAHSEVIKKTRQGDWYSEELFVRFKVVKLTGTIGGKHPLQRFP